jgi:hypothetical protein
MDMIPEQLHKKLMEMGVSDLDAGLVVNCVMRKSAYTWLNTDPINGEQIGKVNEFLAENNAGLKILLSEVANQGKYIWDVKLVNKPAPPVDAPEPSEAQQKKLGPEGRFKSLSELGL